MKDWLKVHDFLYSALDVQLNIVVKAKTQDWLQSLWSLQILLSNKLSHLGAWEFIFNRFNFINWIVTFTAIYIHVLLRNNEQIKISTKWLMNLDHYLMSDSLKQQASWRVEPFWSCEFGTVC